MYVADTLERLNEEQAEEELREALEDKTIPCDYCDEPATRVHKVYNPADAVRDVEGIYCFIRVCDGCNDAGHGMEDLFYCPDCDELFIINHSWDVLAVTIDGERYCQKCALERIEPIPIKTVLDCLATGETQDWMKINNIPGKSQNLRPLLYLLFAG